MQFYHHKTFIFFISFNRDGVFILVMEVVITGIDYEKTFKFNEELSMNDLNEEGTFSLNNNGLTGFDKRLIKYCYMIKIQELMEHLNMKGNYMRVKLFNIFSLFFFEKI